MWASRFIPPIQLSLQNLQLSYNELLDPCCKTLWDISFSSLALVGACYAAAWEMLCLLLAFWGLIGRLILIWRVEASEEMPLDGVHVRQD